MEYDDSNKEGIPYHLHFYMAALRTGHLWAPKPKGRRSQVIKEK